MTFYVLDGFAGVREDTFVLDKSAQEEYQFAGATLTKGKWYPNRIFWNQYYAMTSNQGIGVREHLVAFVKDGHKVFDAIAGPPERTWGRYDRSSGWTIEEEFELTKPHRWSEWHNIVADLEARRLRGHVQEILSIMQEWEKTSLQTALWVSETMQSQSSPQDKTEMFVAYHQWLWHNITRKTITIGYEKSIWGSIPLDSGGKVLSYGAVPVCNGWLVTVSHYNRYLLSWDGHNVTARTLIFPYGEWETYGGWRLWKHDAAILTPQNQLVTFPAVLEIEEEFEDWLVLIDRTRDTHLMLVGLQGELCELDLSEYTPEDLSATLAPCVFPGKQKMLISHAVDWTEHLFSIASITPAVGVIQKPRFLWQVRTELLGLTCPDCVVIKDGATDIFVVAPIVKDQDIGLCFISEHGQFWCPPVFFEDSKLLPYESVYRIKNESLAVIVSRQWRYDPKAIKAIIGMLNGQGYVQLNSGIGLSGPFVPLPEERFDLWAYMNSLLGSEDRFAKQ